MDDREIDEVLKRTAEGGPGVDPALLARMAGSMRESLRPVCPLAPVWVLGGGVAAICAAVAIAGALYFHAYGIQKMDAGEIALIFGLLGIWIAAAAVVSVGEITPGSRRLVAPATLLAAGCVGLAVVFGALFTDYGMEGFVPRGIACLSAGVLHALPAGVGAALVLRRGFAVDRVTAGLATGTLAGLAGVTMLELHCPIFEAPHLMVWHIAVLPVSAAAGALAGWMTGAQRGGRAVLK